MRIGLLGFGVVGRGVYDITADWKDIQVEKVVCLEDVTLPDAQVTRNFQDVLQDDTIDTVVEAMGGLHPAYEFVRAGIEAGKNIVTSNKALVCTYYDELIPLAMEKGVKFRCTAAVGGGICWLSELERARRCETILKVGGIMNGTCNYILESMTTKGLDYADVGAFEDVHVETAGHIMNSVFFHKFQKILFDQGVHDLEGEIDDAGVQLPFPAQMIGAGIDDGVKRRIEGGFNTHNSTSLWGILIHFSTAE